MILRCRMVVNAAISPPVSFFICYDRCGGAELGNISSQ